MQKKKKKTKMKKIQLRSWDRAISPPFLWS